MPPKPKIGLLPLYVALYDKVRPEARDDFEPFLRQIVDGLQGKGIDAVRSNICCIEREFRKAVHHFETQRVDLIVTLHLAYSPSGEAIGPLCDTKLPLLMLDTTTDYAFGHDVEPDRLMYNHGIHGVQDLAAMFRRHGRAFHIVAGHVTESDVIGRAADIARAALAASQFRQTKALRIGESFEGMGDFAVEADILRDVLGIAAEQIAPADLAEFVQRVRDDQIDDEIARDNHRFDVQAPPEVHRRSVRVGLALRACLDARACHAFSMNFLAFDSPQPPVDTVPFLEACKAMSRGLGYAGEGDVLTASLVGALSRAFGRTTFTEIFCPDWKGNTLFLSHMGEINPDVAAATPLLLEKSFPYTRAANPAYLACSIQPGPTVLVNLSPGPHASFRLIVAPVRIAEDSPRKDLHSMIRAWIEPAMPVPRFLEQYSRLGGTHHSALVLGDKADAIQTFASLAGIECCTL